MLNHYGLASITIIVALFLSGCASTKHTPGDPFESVNRVTFEFNRKVDKVLLKPIAKGYKMFTPWPVREGVTNFFSNMGEVPTTINDGLQGQFSHAASDVGRFTINTTVGLLGLFDIASHMGLEKRYNDFGVTLAKWGIRKAPYVVLPILGPSTVRDGLALVVNYQYFTLWPYIYPIRLRNGLFALDVINLRAALLDAENVMTQASLDPYIFMRDAYLQKRNSLIDPKNQTQADLKNLEADPLDDDNFDSESSTNI